MSADLLEQLRVYGEEFVAAQGEIRIQDVRNGRDPMGPVRRGTGRGWAVAVAAAVIVLLLVGGVFLLGGPFANDEAPPVITQPAPLVPSPALGSWQRVGAEPMEPVVGIFDMTQAGSRLIAAGFDPGLNRRQDGVIFASDDGLDWVRLAETDPALSTGTVLIYGIVEGGPGLVAVGMSCEDDGFPCETGPHPTVWTSVDGTAWTRTPNDPDVFGEIGSMSDVVLTDQGIVAAGGLGEFDGLGTASVWFSTDGTDWARVWDGSPDTELLAVAAGPDGLIVGVGSAVDQLGEAVAAVWVSTDGRNWERIAPEAADFGSQMGLNVHMRDVAAGPSGYVAVGTEGGTRVAIWQSLDGRSWTRVDTANQPIGSTGALSSVAALESGWIAAGSGMGDEGAEPVTLWTSSDGSSWDRALVTDATYAEAVVVTDGGITAVAGAMPQGIGFQAAVWAGPTFDPVLPPPDPLPNSLPAIRTRDPGMSCEELATAGYSYAEAVVYWARYEAPSGLDSDMNGVPCDDTYEGSDVAAVFGGSEAVAVQLVSDLPNGVFEATGPAVEAGIVCPTGTTEFAPNQPPTRNGALFRWEDIYRCADGSGSFILGVDVFIEVDETAYGIWNIVSRPGGYEFLTGGGWVQTAPTGPESWSDDSIGRLTIELGG